MSKDYQALSKNDSRKLAQYLASNAQMTLPLVDLIEQSKMVVDQPIESVGRATVETVCESLPTVTRYASSLRYNP